MKKIIALMLAIGMILSSLAVAGAETKEERIDSPNMHLTTTEPLAPSDNLIPEGVEMPECDYSDTKDHWAESTIKMLTADKYVQGNGDGTFAPENNVTRAEFVTMAVNALQAESVAYDESIIDVAADSWYADEIATAKANGILDDALFTDGKFSPETAIIRQDAAMIISATAEKLGAVVTASAIGFIGINEPDEYAAEGLAKAVDMGIIQGDPDGSIRPKDNLTRAEATEVLTKAIEKADRLAIYVDPEKGNDANEGTRKNPLGTVNGAIEMVKANNDDMKNHLFVFIKGGEYYLDEAISMGADVSGSNGYNVVFTSYGDSKAQFMAGKKFSGFELHDENLNIYKTYVGDIASRQVFINGIRGVRARSDAGLTNGKVVDEYGFICDDTFLADYKNIQDLEMVSYSVWTQPRCGVADVQIEDGKAKIIVDSEAWAGGLSGKNNTPWEVPHWYENAYELLNTAGEWYIDSTDGYLYYIPRPFEDPETMVATIPVGERLMTVEGTVDEPVHNVVFDGLEFAYTTWMRPSDVKGYNENQNGAIDGKLPETAVQVRYARQLDFVNNTFNKLGGAGLYMSYSIQDCDIIGNEFADISAGAFFLGWGQGDDYETEIKPTEYKYYTINDRFNNNYVHDIGIEYGAAAAVSATFPKYTEFNNNEVTNSIYSGFHIGWLWETYSEEAEKKGTGFYKVQINNNYIHEVLTEYVHDGGCIYMCGITGGTYDNPSECMNNFAQSSRNAHGALYLEAGSTYWRVENNLVDQSDVKEWPMHGREKALEPRWMTVTNDSSRYNIVKDNFATTANIHKNDTYNYLEEPEIVEMDKLPAEAQKIADEAGLEDKYLAKYPAPAQRLSIDKKNVVAKIGDVVQLNTGVFGRNNAVPEKGEYTLYYTTSDPAVASVDENGLIKINGQGQARVYANLYAEGIVRTKYVDLICGDELKSVNVDHLDLVKDFYKPVNAKGQSKFGRELKIESAEFVSADENIAKVGEEGKIYGVNVGETILKATFTSEGTSIETEIPVTVTDHSKDSQDNLKGNKLPDGIYNAENWASARTPGVTVATVSEDNNSVSVTGEASYYNVAKIADGLYEFDLQIDNPNSWPSLAFKAPDLTKRYVDGDCYFIGFNAEYIEVQRFNKGARTYFIGAEALNPILGTGVPNYGQVLEYGKKHHVVAGTIEEKDGVRIILTVDGKNIVDILDSGEGCLRGEAYFGVYAGSGTFTFSK